MYAKRLKRICSVRGCRNTSTYTISRTREAGNSVIICKDCLEKALEAVKNADVQEVEKPRKTGIPPLFFNGAIRGAVEEPQAMGEELEKAEEENDGFDIDTGEEAQAENLEGESKEEPQEDTNPENTAYVCEHCGKEFKTERGLNTHLRSCVTE